MNTNEAVEAVAMALWEAQCAHWGHYRESLPDLCAWDDLSESKQRELFGEAQAALAAARPLIMEEAWQPIETAPRDGTWVLTWGSDGHGMAKCFPVPDIQPTGWGPDITHWQPLPAPPPAAKTDGAAHD